MTLDPQHAREMGYEITRDSRGRLRVTPPPGDSERDGDIEQHYRDETCSVRQSASGYLVMTTEGQ